MMPHASRILHEPDWKGAPERQAVMAKVWMAAHLVPHALGHCFGTRIWGSKREQQAEAEHGHMVCSFVVLATVEAENAGL